MGGHRGFDERIDRRTALATITGAVAAVGVARGSRAQETTQGGIDYGGWFDDVANFDGTVDRRGQSRVTVTVGAEGNGGPFAFEPPAVRVDPGTTVVWKWTGEGTHNVAALDESYTSQLTDEQGFTFTQTFDSATISKYYCAPHRGLGMKGAVVAGTPDSGSGSEGGGSNGGGSEGDGGGSGGDGGNAGGETNGGGSNAGGAETSLVGLLVGMMDSPLVALGVGFTLALLSPLLFFLVLLRNRRQLD